MNSLHANFTPARHWKDIPQQVSHRAMSSEGRRRAVLRVLKTIGIVASFAAVAWGGYGVVAALQDQPGQMPRAVKAVPLQDLVLVTDGVLDQGWLSRTLGIPKGRSLMELDLYQLRTRLLASGQVHAASLTRNFPATLAVTLAERTPVARLQVQDQADGVRTLYVARDGTVFEGVNYDLKMTETLPWLAGVKLTRQGGTFLPIAGMERVADLLAKAKLEAEHLYATWRRVSLERLASDGEIQVGTKDGTKITFGTNEDFFRQLANLDAILDVARTHPDRVLREINLAVGREPIERDGQADRVQVPVVFEAAPAAAPADAADSPGRAAPATRAPLFTGFNHH